MCSIIVPADDDCGDWYAEARISLEADGTIAFILIREWRSDGVEPDDLSEQAEQPQPYSH